jgi:CRP/FNR family transcriptional regulator, cyclic AMP receptor protein
MSGVETANVRGGSPVEMVRVLEADPELAAQLSPSMLEAAVAQAVAPLLRLEPGLWAPDFEEGAAHGHLGLLVLDGLVARHMRFGQIGSTELLGPRDLIRPWRRPTGRTHAPEMRWEVLAPSQLAVLDRDFALRVRPWPEIVAVVLERGSRRADSLLLQAALRQAVRVEDRLLLALWHFADRWGEDAGAGWTIRIPRLTGEILASIVGARRQTVSTALGQLADRQAISRGRDGTWTLLQRPSQMDSIQVGRRASDHVALLGNEPANQALTSAPESLPTL